MCGELLPEAIRLDDWGYPIIEREVTPELLEHARRAAAVCPTLAVLLEPDGK
jgi:ferredoxin